MEKQHPRIKQLLTLRNRAKRFEAIGLDKVGFDKDTSSALDKAIQICTYWGDVKAKIIKQLVWLEAEC